MQNGIWNYLLFAMTVMFRPRDFCKLQRSPKEQATLVIRDRSPPRTGTGTDRLESHSHGTGRHQYFVT
jgi:hypothetical protein